MVTLDHVLIMISIPLYILGRLCDNMSWHAWDGITEDGIEGIAIAGLGGSALLITIARIKEEKGLKVLFFTSQVKFIIPWSLVILQCVLLFKIFGCYKDEATPLGENQMYYGGCIEYCITLLLSNYIYSSICSEKGELPFLIIFEIVLFAEIIYDGLLLISFINHLEAKPKDYSILFISVMIAWEVLVMDLIFRAVYEDREKAERLNEIEEKIHEHHSKCKLHSGHLKVQSADKGADSALRFQEDVTVHAPNPPHKTEGAKPNQKA